MIKVDNALISKIEKGSRKPTKDQIKKLASALDLKHNQFLTLWLSEEAYEDLERERL